MFPDDREFVSLLDYQINDVYQDTKYHPTIPVKEIGYFVSYAALTFSQCFYIANDIIFLMTIKHFRTASIKIKNDLKAIFSCFFSANGDNEGETVEPVDG